MHALVRWQAPWWCPDCRLLVDTRVCLRCGHSADERRVLCPACGAVVRLTGEDCPQCAASLAAWRAPSPIASPAPAPETVVITGYLLEDRAPGEPPPAPGLRYAPVPLQVPWFYVLCAVVALGYFTHLLWIVLAWPGWAVALLVAALLVVLVVLPRWQPTWRTALHARLGPLRQRLGLGLPWIRRIVVQTDGGQLVGVELAHPQRWPPERQWPPSSPTSPLRLRCEGSWAREGVLLRAERIVVIDERGEPCAPPLRATAWQTFPVAFGTLALLTLLILLLREIAR